jgi:hypothetical protein
MQEIIEHAEELADWFEAYEPRSICYSAPHWRVLEVNARSSKLLLPLEPSRCLGAESANYWELRLGWRDNAMARWLSGLRPCPYLVRQRTEQQRRTNGPFKECCPVNFRRFKIV